MYMYVFSALGMMDKSGLGMNGDYLYSIVDE